MQPPPRPVVSLPGISLALLAACAEDVRPPLDHALDLATDGARPADRGGDGRGGGDGARPPGVRAYPGDPRYLTDAQGKPRFLLGIYSWWDSRSATLFSRAQANRYSAWRELGIGSGWIESTYDAKLAYAFARSTSACPPSSGASDGGCKLDLSKLDSRFWKAFEDRLTATRSRGLVVVAELFGVSGPFGGSGSSTDFKNNFWHSKNSVQGASWSNKDAARRDFFDRNGSLHTVQEQVLDKFLSITSRYDHVVYQPVNEMFGDYSGLDTSKAADFMVWVRDRIRSRKPGAVVLLNTRNISVLPDYGIGANGYEGVTIHAPSEGNVGSGGFSISAMIAYVRAQQSKQRFIGFDVDVGKPYVESDYKEYQREAAWSALVAGSGMYLVLENIFLESPWCCWNGSSGAKSDPDAYFKHLASFLEARSVAPWTMSPAPTGFVRAGTATALVRAGEEVLAYLPSGGTLKLDLRQLPGTLVVEWYNPREGTFTQGATLTGGADQTAFTPPGSSDWVLSVRRASTGADASAADGARR